MKKEWIKKNIGVKIFGLFTLLLLYFIPVYVFKYDYENIILNSILLFVSSYLFLGTFSMGAIEVFFDPHDFDLKLSKEELLEKDLELRIKYPKLFIYNRVVLTLHTLIQIAAFLMFMYGIAQLM